jgi:DNA-binding beta-propeller fold protein YncE
MSERAGLSSRTIPLSAVVLLAGLVLTGCGEGNDVRSAIQLQVTEIEDVGFDAPSGVAYDQVADVYLVSNVQGRLGARDRNGFISRVSPEGEVLNLHWIDLTGTDRAMNSPRGMAIRGDSLFVADLDCVRIFHRESGQDMGYTCLDAVSMITDIDVGPEGSVFIVDSGLELRDGELVPTGSDGVYRIVFAEGRRGSTLARSDDLGHPRGIAVGTRGIFVTTSGSGEVFALTPGGDRTNIFPPSNRHLDGIVFLADGGFVFSSVAEGALTMVDAGGQVIQLAEGIPDPQALAYDPGRNRIIVASPSENRVLFLDLP